MARRRAGAVRRRARRPPLGRGVRARRRIDGPVAGVRGAVATRHDARLGPPRARARVRGGLRPGRRRALAAPRAVPALAARPRRAHVHHRPTRRPRRRVMTASVDLHVDDRTVRITKPDRVLWPRLGLTKAWMLDYYRSVADVL